MANLSFSRSLHCTVERSVPYNEMWFEGWLFFSGKVCWITCQDKISLPFPPGGDSCVSGHSGGEKKPRLCCERAGVPGAGSSARLYHLHGHLAQEFASACPSKAPHACSHSEQGGLCSWIILMNCFIQQTRALLLLVSYLFVNVNKWIH